MLLRTHLTFGIFMIILFLQHVNHKLIFVSMVFIATIFPDLDSSFSSWGRHLVFRPLQFFVKHRGIMHSFSFAILISVFLTIFWPVASFGFFIGYSVHLICDSFTKQGIKPFWPLKFKSKGPLRSGSRTESSIFIFLIVVDVLLFFKVF